MSELDAILGQITALRTEGTIKGAATAAKVEGLEKTVSQHDKRIAGNERELGELTTELKAIPDRVVQKINGNIPPRRGETTLKAGPLAGMPVKYVFYAVVLALAVAGGIIMFAITHGKLSDLAEAIQTVRGQTSAAVEVPTGDTAEGLARPHE